MAVRIPYQEHPYEHAGPPAQPARDRYRGRDLSDDRLPRTGCPRLARASSRHLRVPRVHPHAPGRCCATSARGCGRNGGVPHTPGRPAGSRSTESRWLARWLARSPSMLEDRAGRGRPRSAPRRASIGVDRAARGGSVCAAAVRRRLRAALLAAAPIMVSLIAPAQDRATPKVEPPKPKPEPRAEDSRQHRRCRRARRKRRRRSPLRCAATATAAGRVRRAAARAAPAGDAADLQRRLPRQPAPSYPALARAPASRAGYAARAGERPRHRGRSAGAHLERLPPPGRRRARHRAALAVRAGQARRASRCRPGC